MTDQDRGLIQLLPFLVMAVFTVVVYYRAVAPAYVDLTETSQAIIGGEGPLAGQLGTLDGIMLIWLPLIWTVGVLLVGYVISVGQRGTSFRP